MENALLMPFIIFCFIFIAGTKCAPESGPTVPTAEADQDSDVQAIYEDAVDFAQSLGLAFMPGTHRGRGDEALVQPITLFPTVFPRELYEQAKEVHKAYLLLYFRLANDLDFLIDIYEIAAKTNEHIRNYLHILKTIHSEGIKQPKMLLIGRSDYMCHVVKDDNTEQGEHYELKQVEFNTGQIGGVHIAGTLTQLHHRTLRKAGVQASKDQMPPNDGDIVIAEALYMAWLEFGDPNAIFLFVASKSSVNRFGQRLIEYLLERVSKNKMKIIRMSLIECGNTMKAGELVLDPVDNSLRLYGQKVGVTYIATESSNPKPQEWEVRLMFERSTAIKCPSVSHDLAGQKKVQQLLAKPGMVERFLPEPENAKYVEAIRRTFAGLWALHDKDEQSQKAIQDAIENPQNYVVKANRDGGGHNFFDEKVREKLLSFTDEERDAHILMQKLNPMVSWNYFIRPYSGILYGKVTTELSIIGYLFGNSSDLSVKKNVQKGHFLRTKMAHVNEGGVSMGTGAWDIPFLV